MAAATPTFTSSNVMTQSPFATPTPSPGNTSARQSTFLTTGSGTRVSIHHSSINNSKSTTPAAPAAGTAANKVLRPAAAGAASPLHPASGSGTSKPLNARAIAVAAKPQNGAKSTYQSLDDMFAHEVVAPSASAKSAARSQHLAPPKPKDPVVTAAEAKALKEQIARIAASQKDKPGVYSADFALGGMRQGGYLGGISAVTANWKAMDAQTHAQMTAAMHSASTQAKKKGGKQEGCSCW